MIIKNNLEQNDNSEIFFSIIICCYNSEEYIRETLNSIINQTYKKWEIVIVDDGSFDNTKAIIKEYINKNYPIRYYFQENNGFAAARNKAIKMCKNDWIAIIDHDDICRLDRLENQREDIINNPKCSLFFGDAIYFDKFNQFSKFDNLNSKDGFKPHKLNLKKIQAFENLIIYGCFIVSSTVILNKRIIKEIGYFDAKYKFVPDYDFFLRSSKKFNIYCSNRVISKWRIHEKQTSNNQILLYYKELIQLLKNILILREIKFKIKMIIINKLFRNYCKMIILMFNNVRK